MTRASAPLRLNADSTSSASLGGWILFGSILWLTCSSSFTRQKKSLPEKLKELSVILTYVIALYFVATFLWQCIH